MKRIAWIIPALSISLVACSDKGGDTGGDGGTDTTDTDTDTDTDGGTDGCEVEVDGTFPADGETDAFYRTTVDFDLSEEDSTATITLADSSGGAVTGTQTMDGSRVIFTPDSPLTSGETYSATASLCGGEREPTVSFTVGDLGSPLTGDLVGETYVVDLNNAEFIKPAGVADLLLGQLNNNILLGVTSTSPDLQIIGAISLEGSTAQDTCEPTIDFPSADFSESPFFAIGPQDTTISAAGYEIEISSLEVSGAFAADGSYFGGGTLAGELDARVLAPLLGDLLDTDDPDQICALVAGFGVQCETCSSDGEPYCLEILVKDITATTTGATLVERTQADIDADGSCTE